MTTETKPETKPVEKPSRAARMREFFTHNPTASVRDAATLFGTTYQIAYMVRKGMLDKAKAKRVKKVVAVKAPKALPTAKEKSDPVNHPAHYKTGGIETIDFIEAKKLNYNLGNVVKYITRSDHKGNRKQDLEKALWYLNREINGK